MGRFSLVLFPVILFAFVLRLQGLNDPDLGMDGGWSTALSALPVADLFRISALDVHPPLYYLLLNGWQAVAGRTPFALKYVSLFASLTSVPLIYVTGKRLFGKTAGLLAALLLMVAPVQIISVGIIRDISLGLFLILLFSYLFLRLAGSISASFWETLAYSTALLAAVYTSYFAVPVILAQVLAIVLSTKTRNQLGRWFVLWLVPGLGFFPWLLYFLPALLDKFVKGQSARGIHTAEIGPLEFLGGFAQQLTGNEFSQLPAILPELAFLAGLVGGGLLLYLQPRPSRGVKQDGGSAPARSFLIFSLSFLFVLTFLLARNWVGEGVPVRYALMSAPFFLLVVAACLECLGQWFRRTANALLLIILLFAMSTLNDFRARPMLSLSLWDPVVMTRTLDANAGAGDGVVFTTLEQAGYYQSLSKDPLKWYYLISGLDFMEAAASPKAEDVLPRALKNHQVIWLMAYQGSDSDVTKSARTWLDREAYFATSQWLSDTLVLSYVTPQENARTGTVAANFGSKVELASYNVSTSTKGIALALNWRPLIPLERDYKVFIHLLDSAGKPIAQQDSPPQNGLAPTSTWQVGQLYEDHHGLLLPPGTMVDGLVIELGLYSDEGRLSLPNGDTKGVVKP